MRGEIKALHRRIGATSIYVTHDQVEAMTMADQIIVLRNGRIEQAGAPLEIYDRPANSFVASFIGSPGMNLLEATLAEDRASVAVKGGQELQLDRTTNAPAGTRLLVGIRPEHFVVAANGVAGETLNIVVDSIETTGAEQAIIGTVSGQPLSIVLRDRRLLGCGDHLQLVVSPANIHIFNETGAFRIAD
jgi:multiple sugar transport system ATP-binding protein